MCVTINYKAVGDFVKMDEIVGEIETDKVCVMCFPFQYIYVVVSSELALALAAMWSVQLLDCWILHETCSVDSDTRSGAHFWSDRRIPRSERQQSRQAAGAIQNACYRYL